MINQQNSSAQGQHRIISATLCNTFCTFYSWEGFPALSVAIFILKAAFAYFFKASHHKVHVVLDQVFTKQWLNQHRLDSFERYHKMFEPNVFKLISVIKQFFGMATYYKSWKIFGKNMTESLNGILLVASDKDKMVYPGNTLKMAKVLERYKKKDQIVQTEMIFDAGHIVNSERADEFNRLLFYDFLPKVVQI
jgi:pimeloyl-ACP methyl ester carboxylesterase